MKQAFLFVMMLGGAQSLYIVQTNKKSELSDSNASDKQKYFRRILESLANAKLYLTSGDRRSIDQYEVAKAKNIYEVMLKSMAKGKYEKMLRRAAEENIKQAERSSPDNRHELVEKELQSAVKKKTSALLTNAWVQKRGRNDFLVLEDSAQDPFVTIIPNNIYYNIEKKCVNWLDDCSLQGIRAKLLHKVRSPH